MVLSNLLKKIEVFFNSIISYANQIKNYGLKLVLSK